MQLIYFKRLLNYQLNYKLKINIYLVYSKSIKMKEGVRNVDCCGLETIGLEIDQLNFIIKGHNKCV